MKTETKNNVEFEKAIRRAKFVRGDTIVICDALTDEQAERAIAWCKASPGLWKGIEEIVQDDQQRWIVKVTQEHIDNVIRVQDGMMKLLKEDMLSLEKAGVIMEALREGMNISFVEDERGDPQFVIEGPVTDLMNERCRDAARSGHTYGSVQWHGETGDYGAWIIGEFVILR